MKEVSSLGRTVLFVSHNLAAIRTLCNRGLVLNNGVVHSDGPAKGAILDYTSRFERLQLKWHRPADLPIVGIGFEHLAVSLTGEQPAHKMLIAVTIRCCGQYAPSMIAIDIRDPLSQVIMQALPNPEPFIPGGTAIYDLAIDVHLPPLVPGVYELDLWLGAHHSATSDFVRGAVNFEVLDSPTTGRIYPHTLDHGAIVPVSTIVRLERKLN
jgi:lipopolysaccharide transport system ATP-binding protein